MKNNFVPNWKWPVWAGLTAALIYAFAVMTWAKVEYVCQIFGLGCVGLAAWPLVSGTINLIKKT